MKLDEARVNDILDDLILRGIVVEVGEEIELAPAFRDAWSRAVGSPLARVHAAAAAIGFDFPQCCVPEYESVLARLAGEA